MTYEQYIEYHRRGDAGVEERAIATICRRLRLSSWDSFRLIYYYATTYHIPSALAVLNNPKIDYRELEFRTDRRYVRANGAYGRMMRELTRDKEAVVVRQAPTTEAFGVVNEWFYFGRYAAFLFLEVYINVFHPNWVDDLKFTWARGENYVKGAVAITGTRVTALLDEFLERVKVDTGDNCFAIETSLCAVEKIRKGTRWQGYYTERLIKEAQASKYGKLIMSCI
jgi:hypothetical protein